MASESERVMAQLGEFVEGLITKITLDITANLIEDTPVDTGWARANWVPRIGEAFNEDVGGQADPQRVASSGAIQQQAIGQIASGTYRIEQGDVFISNNVPYILPLNDGHSPQARPAGYIQRGITKALTVDILSIQT